MMSQPEAKHPLSFLILGMSQRIHHHCEQSEPSRYPSKFCQPRRGVTDCRLRDWAALTQQPAVALAGGWLTDMSLVSVAGVGGDRRLCWVMEPPSVASP